jgi:hypothetical protein
MPNHIFTNGYPCPILFVTGFEGINFRNYVTVRMPHPCPAKYPTGQISLMCLEDNQWNDITDQTNQVICVEHESFIELHVRHFSGYWLFMFNGFVFKSERIKHQSRLVSGFYYPVFRIQLLQICVISSCVFCVCYSVFRIQYCMFVSYFVSCFICKQEWSYNV